MSALIIDTSSWVAYFNGEGSDEIELGLEEGRVFLPPIVASELSSGRMGQKQRRQLRELLAELPLCECDLNHWLRVGELRASLAVKGLVLSTPDAHVAQCALDIQGQLSSLDAVFRKVAKHTSLSVL